MDIMTKDARGFLIFCSTAVSLRRDAKGFGNDAKRSLHRVRDLLQTAAWHVSEGRPESAAEYGLLAARSLEMFDHSRHRAKSYRRAARGGAF